MERRSAPTRRGGFASVVASIWVFDLVPAIALAMYGGIWITLHAPTGRGFTHTVFQSLALAENVVAIFLVRRKPLASLIGILFVYVLVDLEPTTLPAAMFALAVVASLTHRRGVVVGTVASVAAVVGMPFLHGDPVTAPSVLLHLAVCLAAVAVGLYVKSKRRRSAAVQAQAGQRSGHTDEFRT